jgi:hypothetical protein
MIDELAGHRFAACSWCEWLATFPQDLSDHADRVIARFHP